MGCGGGSRATSIHTQHPAACLPFLPSCLSSCPCLPAGHTSVDPQALLRTQQSTLSTSLGGAVKRPMMLPTTPSALRHQQQQQQQPPPVAIATSTAHQNTPPLAAAAAPPLSVLHVRGKSGLKHTKQLLDCWVQHPEWPHLTVVGPMPNEQISGAEAKRFMAAPNIHVPKPGKHQGELRGRGAVAVVAVGRAYLCCVRG